jgi:hypothetical protein
MSEQVRSGGALRVCSSKVLAIAGRGAACRRGAARVGTQVAGVITSSRMRYAKCREWRPP